MKVPANEAERFARAPRPDIRAILVYGPDAGLVRERGGILIRSVVEDPSDPFRVAELTGRQLSDDPARLADESAALALTGGRRVLVVDAVGDESAGLFATFLSAPPGEALVVLLAGDLPNRSKLRQAFEKAELGAALPCYRDDQRSLQGVISGMLGEHSLKASGEALAYLAGNLGGDRMLTRRELEKLILYKGSADGEVSIEDARACIGDTAALGLEDLAFAVGDGDPAAVDRAFSRALEEGGSPVSALRAVARHLQRLHFVAGASASGQAAEEPMKRLRPPVFWKLAGRFKTQSRAWPVPLLAKALERLLEAEAACKRTAAPDATIAAHTLALIAARARRAAR